MEFIVTYRRQGFTPDQKMVIEAERRHQARDIFYERALIEGIKFPKNKKDPVLSILTREEADG